MPDLILVNSFLSPFHQLYSHILKIFETCDMEQSVSLLIHQFDERYGGVLAQKSEESSDICLLDVAKSFLAGNLYLSCLDLLSPSLLEFL
jgi:hypothetical protein